MGFRQGLEGSAALLRSRHSIRVPFSNLVQAGLQCSPFRIVFILSVRLRINSEKKLVENYISPDIYVSIYVHKKEASNEISNSNHSFLRWIQTKKWKVQLYGSIYRDFNDKMLYWYFVRQRKQPMYSKLNMVIMYYM